jgi:hypothetical protein
MSLDTKRAEIRKLEERARQRAEALAKSEAMLDEDAVRWGRCGRGRGVEAGCRGAAWVRQHAPQEPGWRPVAALREPGRAWLVLLSPAHPLSLPSPTQRFDAFLKENDEKVQEAIRHAEAETKARVGAGSCGPVGGGAKCGSAPEPPIQREQPSCGAQGLTPLAAPPHAAPPHPQTPRPKPTAWRRSSASTARSRR